MAEIDLVALHLDNCRFSEAEAAAIASGRGSPKVEALSLLGRRLFRLDLEDVQLEDRPDLAKLVPRALMAKMGPVAFPSEPDQKNRGALSSFIPLYQLLLEVFDVRWRRGQMLHALAILHLVAEFGGHLAWESALGHPADPAMLGKNVAGRASRWGDLDDDECGQSRSQKHQAAAIADRDPLRSPEAWRRFMREDFSKTGDQLVVCATRESGRVWGRRPRVCEARCSVWTRHSAATREALERRCQLVSLLGRSPLLQLRHSAPIGHFFGVPSRDEVLDAWASFAKRVRRDTDLDLGAGDLTQQLGRYCSGVAGVPLAPSKLLATTAKAFSMAAAATAGR